MGWLRQLLEWLLVREYEVVAFPVGSDDSSFLTCFSFDNDFFLTGCVSLDEIGFHRSSSSSGSNGR